MILRFLDKLTSTWKRVDTENGLPVSLIGNNVKDYGAVTLSDSTNLPKAAIGFIVTGTAGTVCVIKPNGQEVTIPASVISVGQIVPLPALRFKSTGTTATGIWAVYGA